MPVKIPKAESPLEAAFARICRAMKFPPHSREYRFNAIRRWKFDFAWPEQKVAVEIEGGIWTAGRHTRGSGFRNDCDKYNAAQLGGWSVYRFCDAHLRDGSAMETTAAALGLMQIPNTRDMQLPSNGSQ